MAPKPWKATLLPWKVGFGVVFFFYNKDTESILLACSFVFLTNFSQNKFYPVAHVTIHSETEQQENYKPWMVVGAVMMEKDFLGNSSWEVQSILGPYLQRAWYIKQEKCTQLTLTKCSNRRTNTNVTGAQSGTNNSRGGWVSRKEASEESTVTRDQKPTNHIQKMSPRLDTRGHWRRLGARWKKLTYLWSEIKDTMH